MPQRLSIIIPVLNEAATLGETLLDLQALRRDGHEVIVVDGGSEDATRDIAAPLADEVLVSPRGRAAQMNCGAAHATGDVLLFLHADTRLPPDAATLALDGLSASARSWGRFDVEIKGRAPALRIIAMLMNQRSRLTGIATGDQAIFVKAAGFHDVGGFPDQALMEDIAFSTAMKKRGPPLCLAARVVTSGRRWEKHGVIRTVLMMWRLRLEYYFGANVDKLAERYGHTPRPP